MGVHDNISIDRFPAQGKWKGKRVRVSFHYDTGRVAEGVIIRDDEEAPHVTIIQLDDGRAVLTTECHYAPIE